MRKILFIIIFLSGTNALNAQYYDDSPQLGLSLDAAILTTSKVSETNHPGVGGTLKLSLPMSELSDFVFIGSLMTFRGKKNRVYPGNKVGAQRPRNILPVLVGYRQYLSPLYNPNTLYIEPHLGLTFDGTKHTAITYGAALGYLINNKIDLSAKYQAFGGQYTSLSFIGLSIGYNFGINL